VAVRLTEHYGYPDWPDRFTNHILRLTVKWEEETETGPNRYIDEHGTEWQTGEVRHIVKPALTSPTMKGYDMPDYRRNLQGALEPILEQIEPAKPHQFIVVGFGFGLFERAWMMRGFEPFFMDLLDNPAFAEDLLDTILQRQLELLEELVKLPADGILFSDDFGDQRGIMIGPERWRRFIKPRQQALYQRVHDAGKWTFHHSCGNTFDILPDLIETGLDCHQCVQPEPMDVYEIKRRYGDRLRLWGGVGTQHLLPFATPAEIRAEVNRVARELGRGGGYILTSAKELRPEVPTENAVAFLEAVLALHADD